MLFVAFGHVFRIQAKVTLDEASNVACYPGVVEKDLYSCGTDAHIYLLPGELVWHRVEVFLYSSILTVAFFHWP